MIVSAMPVIAVSDTEGAWSYSVSDGKAEITGFDADAYGKTEVVIPNTLGGYPVTSIGSWTFSWCSSLTSIEIPSSVTSIGYGAFEGCSSLTSIEIPSSVTSIGEDAFYDCSSLKNVYFIGTKEQADEIIIGTWGNDCLLNAIWHYNTSGPETIIAGDLDGDGITTDDDAIYLLFHTFFPEDYPIDQDVDFNHDGVVSDDDAIYLLFFTFFPEDYPIE